MAWRQRWALLEATQGRRGFVTYRMQYLDGTQRTITVDGKVDTIEDACAMLDEIEATRCRVPRLYLD